MNIAIIVAGGTGSRLGGEMPKQYIEVCGKPIIVICLEKFEQHKDIDEIIVVCKDEYFGLVKRMAKDFRIHKLRTVASAGSTRRESVLNGLRAVRDDDAIVLIHDAARPLVTARIISDNIAGVAEHGAVITVLPANDTILQSADGLFIDSALKRRELYHAQTPQSFKFEVIMSAHLNTGPDDDVTDDCRLALAAGYKVAACTGNEMNFKVTTSEDLARLKAIVEQGRE